MLQPSVLRQRAGELLQTTTYNPKKLVLIHTAITVGSYLIINIINYILSLQIAQTGGLSGIYLRSVLSAIQQSLNLFSVILLPFWEMGLLFSSLQWAKGDSAMPKDLPEGFRRFGPILRLRILQGILLLIIIFAISNISSILFLLTPFANPLVAQIESLMELSVTAEHITEEQMMAFIQSATPMLVIFGVLCAIVLLFVFYRIRFADFIILEERSALKALIKSIRITKKSYWQVVKLDLSFWWFYLLQILCIALGYGYAFLPLTEDVFFLLFSALSLLAQGILLWQCQGTVLTTYALAYQTLSQPTPPPQPDKIIWDI